MITLLSGYNPRAVLTLCRFLDEQELPFSIIASSEEDKVTLGKYWSNVVIIRDSFILDTQTLISLCKKVSDEVFLLPTTEYLNRILVRDKDLLLKHGIKSGLPDADCYEKVSDKHSFRKLCEEWGISVPQEVSEDYPRKCVKKPRKYNGEPPILLHSGEKVGEDYYLDKFVKGHSVYLLFSLPKKGHAKVFSQINYLQQSKGGSITFAESSTHYKNPISKKCVDMLKSIGFYGVAMIEFRVNQDEWIAIECNPRFWGPLQLTEDCNYHIVGRFFKDNGFPVKISGGFRDGVYLWSDGIDAYNVMHKGFSHNVEKHLDKDVYYRDMNSLQTLYDTASKHSNYQRLPFVEGLNIANPQINRFEEERWDYIKSRVSFTGETLLDIGGNTGYFSVRASQEGADTTMIEGNSVHCRFVKQVASQLGLDIKVENNYLTSMDECFDISLFLNVVHHLGDDFSSNVSDDPLCKMSEMVAEVCSKSSVTILQMGYNWKGDKNLPLFSNGTKDEMKQFVLDSIPEGYHVAFTGVLNPTTLTYEDATHNLMRKFVDLGEFGNRPIFIITKV